VRGVLVSADIGDISVGLGGATRTCWALSAFGAPQEMYPCVEPLSLGPFKAIRASSSTCFVCSLAVSLRDGG
jgi:hypothetical protein